MKLWKIDALKCDLHMILTAIVAAPTAERAWELLSAEQADTYWEPVTRSVLPYMRQRIRTQPFGQGDLYEREHYEITEVVLTEEGIISENHVEN